MGNHEGPLLQDDVAHQVVERATRAADAWVKDALGHTLDAEERVSLHIDIWTAVTGERPAIYGAAYSQGNDLEIGR